MKNYRKERKKTGEREGDGEVKILKNIVYMWK